jgi:hypothetical protein
LSLSGVGGWVVEVAVLMVDVGVEELVVGVGTGEVSDDELAVGTVESSDVVAVSVEELVVGVGTGEVFDDELAVGTVESSDVVVVTVVEISFA